ncbi:hypothetical protein BDZ91DRAFT_418668 [Kalaharituber pfeilii]|nr:hypothetical protein BDZ91DRAFT_418668 [Kalaharituber pfeilii]
MPWLVPVITKGRKETFDIFIERPFLLPQSCCLCSLFVLPQEPRVASHSFSLCRPIQRSYLIFLLYIVDVPNIIMCPIAYLNFSLSMLAGEPLLFCT